MRGEGWGSFIRKARGLFRAAIVADVMLSPPPVILPDDTLAQAAERMGLSDVDRLPVVDAEDPRRLVGIVTHRDLLGVSLRRGAADARGPLGMGAIAGEGSGGKGGP